MTKDNQLITGTNNAQNVLDTVAKFEEVANEDNKISQVVMLMFT